jgi:hypothetical protein
VAAFDATGLAHHRVDGRRDLVALRHIGEDPADLRAPRARGLELVVAARDSAGSISASKTASSNRGEDRVRALIAHLKASYAREPHGPKSRTASE